MLGTRIVSAEEQTISVMKKNLRMRMSNIHREREGERDRHKKTLYFLIATIITISTTPSLTKGYKVTLYSDYLRATSLYAIYRNSPNLGCTKGQCEYDHYTLVFETPL